MVVQTIDDIRRVAKPLLHEYGFDGAVLFGSFAKNTPDRDSDIDIVVSVPAGTKPRDVFAFGYDLSKATDREVDVYGSNEIIPGSLLDIEYRDTGVAL